MRGVARKHRLLHPHPPRLGPALRPRLRRRAGAALEPRRRPAPQRRCTARRGQFRARETDSRRHVGPNLRALRRRLSAALLVVLPSVTTHRQSIELNQSAADEREILRLTPVSARIIASNNAITAPAFPFES